MEQVKGPNEFSELLTLFDTISTDTNTVIDVLERVMKSFVETSLSFEETRQKWKVCVEENSVLLTKTAEYQNQITELEKTVQTARRLIDEEKRKTKIAMKERDQFEHQIELLRETLADNKNIHEDTKTMLNLNRLSRGSTNDLDTIPELDSTDRVMSDLSYTRDEDDDFNVSEVDGRGAKRQSVNDENTEPKKRRKSNLKTVQVRKNDKVIATTTVTVECHGPAYPGACFPHITTIKKSDSEESLENVILRSPSKLPFSMTSINTRPHKFINKSMIKGEICNVCNKRIKFSVLASKCRECKTVCHVNCKDKVPLPCIPLATTPNKNNWLGTIADFTPKRAPMVPALVVHCIKEIEARGLSEIGLYRIPGSDKEVKCLKEKFLKGKGIPNLSQVSDIHTICGCLKEFLRSLKEPIITQIRWDEFTRASKISDSEDRRAKLFQIVSELPQPNRDTLAYIVLHLQRIAEVPDCKMPITNLSKIFGPTIVGYSRNEPENLLGETNLGIKVMTDLILMPAEYWETFIRETDKSQDENDMQKTPSSNSLFALFQTPSNSTVNTKRRRRYFETP